MRASVALVLACACGPQTPQERPRALPLPPVPMSFTIEAGPALQYNAPFDAPPNTPLENTVLAGAASIASRLKAQLPVEDTRLSNACAALAAVVPETNVVPYPLVQFAMTSNGLIEPSPHLLVVWGRFDDDPIHFVAALQPSLKSVLPKLRSPRIGVGAVKRLANGEGAVVVALLESKLDTEPIPRAVPAGANVKLNIALATGYRMVRVSAIKPDGHAVRSKSALEPNVAKFATLVECGAATGKLQIAIEGIELDDESETLANFPVWCGEQPPQSMTAKRRVETFVGSDDAERGLLRLVNIERDRLGLSPLLRDVELSALALRHSESMLAHGRVAHTLPGLDDVTKRARAALGDPTVRVLVGQANGTLEAHDGLFELPSIRAALLSPSSTHLSIGVAYGPVQINATQQVFVTYALRGDRE